MWVERARAAFAHTSHIAREPHQRLADALVQDNGARLLSETVRRVTGDQIRAVGMPWDGCFGARPTGEIAWRDGWDPNSRALVSLVLALAVVSERLTPDDVDRALAAAHYAVVAEESTGRLPVTYTNVVACHGASLLTVGHLTSDAAMKEKGLSWLADLVSDHKARGGFCEFNSPTYGGVTLLALGLASQVEASLWDTFHDVRQCIESRWSSDAGEFHGPYVRSYGARVSDYVAITAAMVGAQPPMLTARHAGDWGMAALGEVAGIVPGDSREADCGGQTLHDVITVRGVGTMSFHRKGHIAWAGAAGLGTSWHPQTMSATVHSSGGGIGLVDPMTDVIAQPSGLELHDGTAGASACPAWLWGGLQRPLDPRVAVPRDLTWMSSGDVEMIGSGELRVGDVVVSSDQRWERASAGTYLLSRGAAFVEVRAMSTGRPA